MLDVTKPIQTTFTKVQVDYIGTHEGQIVVWNPVIQQFIAYERDVLENVKEKFYVNIYRNGSSERPVCGAPRRTEKEAEEASAGDSTYVKTIEFEI